MNIDYPISTEQQPSFMQTLLTIHNNCIPAISNTQYYLDMSDETLEEPSPDNSIPLSTEDKSRLYSPWKYSLVVKVFGRKVGHLTLKQKIQTLWQPTESMSLIDLGNEFFLIKFEKEKNMNRALHGVRGLS